MSDLKHFATSAISDTSSLSPFRRMSVTLAFGKEPNWDEWGLLEEEEQEIILQLMAHHNDPEVIVHFITNGPWDNGFRRLAMDIDGYVLPKLSHAQLDRMGRRARTHNASVDWMRELIGKSAVEHDCPEMLWWATQQPWMDETMRSAQSVSSLCMRLGKAAKNQQFDLAVHIIDILHSHIGLSQDVLRDSICAGDLKDVYTMYEREIIWRETSPSISPSKPKVM